MPPCFQPPIPKRKLATRHDGKSVPLSVIPDRLISLAREDDRNFNLNYCLEVDRSKQSVAARRLSGKSSFGRKIRTYYAAFQQDRHIEQWGFARFRVLTLTTSEKRIATMIKTQCAITNDRAPAMFLYTTPQRLAEHGAFAPIWISAEGDGISLLDRK
jgi:hypothetical protein